MIYPEQLPEVHPFPGIWLTKFVENIVSMMGQHLIYPDKLYQNLLRQILGQILKIQDLVIMTKQISGMQDLD